MKKNIQVSFLAFEMFQELPKKSRPSTKPEDWIERYKRAIQQIALRDGITQSAFNEDLGSFKSS